MRNSAGQLISSVQSASGQASRTTRYLYNTAGQQVAQIDPAGNASYLFYDADGRVSGTVDATGAVAAVRYDVAGHVTGTTQYATSISTSGWVSGGALAASLPTDLPVPFANAADRTSRVIVDAAGRALATVDAEGNVTTTTYDGEGHAVASTAYATALTSAQLTALGSTPAWAELQANLTSNAKDRTTYIVYDADGQTAATIDAAGWVTITSRDAARRAIKTVAYATALTTTQRSALGSTPTLSVLQTDLVASASDQTTRTYYDGAGEMVAQVDADGYLTTQAYDETTHKNTSARYATALTSTQLTALTGAESMTALVALLGASPASQVSTTVYNADGEMASHTAVDGTVTACSYNAVGQVTGMTVTPAAGQGVARSTSATDDAFGDQLTNVDGNHATTTYTYNVLGQRITASDALGNVTYSYYDAVGRVAYTVQGQPGGSTRNALGNVTAFVYNALGQLTSTRQYASVLTLTGGTSSGTTLNPGMATLAQVTAAVAALPLVAGDANGLIAYTYTLDGQVASRTDGLGYQIVSTYDAFGDRTQVQQQLSAPGSALSAANSTISMFAYDGRGERTGETDAVGTSAVLSTSTIYDAFGRVISTTDGNGNIITYTYDNLGREVGTSQIVQGTARVTQTTYDAFARVVKQFDALNNVTSYQYDVASHKTTVTTPDGVMMTKFADPYGDTLSVQDGAGGITHYAYDGDGQLLTTTDALGNLTTNVYDGDGELTRTTDAAGRIVTYAYNASGKVLTRTVDPSALNPGGLNLTTSYTYDGQGRELSVTDPAGTVTTYTYDADGNTLTQVQDAGTGKLNLTTTSTYDGAGKTLTVIAGAGTAAARTTQYVYDTLERLSQQIVDPGAGHLNLTTRYAYDGNNNLLSVTDATGHVTRSVYDDANEAVFTINGAGALTQMWYDVDGRVTATRAYALALNATQIAGLGVTPTVAQVGTLASALVGSGDQVGYRVYDAAGKLRYTLDTLGNATETRYDVAGRVSETLVYSHPINWATVSSSNLWAPLAAGTAYTSLAGLVSGAGNSDANAEATLHLYDADGRSRFVVQQNLVNGQLVGVVSEQRYDVTGRVIASVAYGNALPLSATSALSAQLTTASVVQSLASVLSQTTQQVYDSAGRLRYAIDTTGHVIETQYDADGRVHETLAYANPITLPATLTVATLASAVTASGITGINEPRISTTGYDAVGRVLTTGDALGIKSTISYDATGLALTQKDRDGNVTTATYDKAGRKTLVQSPLVNVGSWTGPANGQFQQGGAYLYTTTGYDGVGNVISVSQGTGPDSAHVTVLSTTTYAYDAAGHQTTTTYPGSVTTTVVYNALGQAVVDKDANGHYQYKVYTTTGEEAYAVDADGFITSDVYDAAGNVTAITRYATALNTAAITGWSAGQPLTLAQLQQGLVGSVNDRTISTTYDLLHQKTQVVQPSISYVLSTGALIGNVATGSPTTTYTYDAYGNVTSTATLIQGSYTSGGITTSAVWATTYTYYDALNRVVMTVIPTGAYTSPQGYVTTTAYNAFGDVTGTVQYAQAISTSAITTALAPALPGAATYASGGNRSSTYSYDAIGRKTGETDAGNFNYTGGTLGQPNGTVGYTSANSVSTLTYDGENRVTSLTVNGATTSTSYDALGRVINVTLPSHQVLASNWQSTMQTTPADDLTTAALYTTVSPYTYYIYDALGHTLVTTVTNSQSSAAEQTWAWYDARGRQIQVQDANGYEHYTTYDNNGNALTQSDTQTGNGGSATVTTTYTYAADNQQLSTAVQRSGQSGYDSYALVKYNAFGEVVAKGDNNGYEAQYSYNNVGQLGAAPDATTGAVHTYGYDLANHLLVDKSMVTGGGAATWTHNGLDFSGRIVQQSTPSDSAGSGVDSTQTTRGYDRWNNVTSTTDAAGNTTTAYYDSQNHLIQEVEPNVLVVSETGVRTWATPTKAWYYNLNGELMGVTDEDGHASWNTYDTAGNLTIAQDATGAKTITAYDALGRAAAMQTPPANTAAGAVAHITYSAYDNLNQVIDQGDFLLNSAGTARTQQAQQAYLLNSHGDRIQVTDALGYTSYYDYDSQHRVLKSQTPVQHASNWAESFTYDANGHKTGDTTANGDHQSWVVDYFGRVTSHVDLNGTLTSYAYDASSGLLTSESSNWISTVAQGDPAYMPASMTGSLSTVDYTYYADGQLQQRTDITGTTQTAWDTYQYDANGNAVSDTSWTSDGAGQVVYNKVATTYDSHDRIGVVTNTNVTTGAVESREAINYDSVGNRRAVFVQSAYGPKATPISGNGGPPTGTIATQVPIPGQLWSFSVASSFTDNVGFGLTFAPTVGSALPSWLTLNSNGNLTGTPTAAGSWTLKITATDVNGQAVNSTFTVTVPVATPVFIGGASNQTGGVHGALSFAVPGATDGNGSALTYSATLSSGAALPSWLSFNVGTRTFSGTPPVGSVGSYVLKVTATAANGGSAAETFTLTVAPTAPVYTSGVSNQTTFGGRAFSFAYAASDFTEADGDALTYTAGAYVMNGGAETDSALPSWMSFNASTRTFTGTPPTSAVGQTFTLYLKAANPQGQTAEAHFTMTVAQYVQPPPVYNGNLVNQNGVIGGSPLNLALPANAFVEPDGGALTYSALVLLPAHSYDYWNANHTETYTRNVPAQWLPIADVNLSINATTGQITGYPRVLNYGWVDQNTVSPPQEDLSYQLQITATNGQGGAVAASFVLSNTYAPLVLQGTIPAQTITPNGSAWVYTLPANLVSDPYGAGLRYTSNAPGWMGLSGGAFHGINEPAGSYLFTVTATDGLGRTVSTTVSVTVNNVAPVLGGLTNQVVVNGTAMTAYTTPIATDANGDVITYSASGMPAGISFNASTHTFTGTTTATGAYTVTVTATDSKGVAAHATFVITVNAPANQPPVYAGGFSMPEFAPNHTNVWTMPAGAFTNPSGRALSYSMSQSTTLAGTWNINASTGTLTAPVGNLRNELTVTVTITATDPVNGLSVSQALSVDVLGTSSNMMAGGGSPASMAMTTMTVPATGPNLQSDWFVYDADNRVTVNNGALVNGQIVLTVTGEGSYGNSYDAAGNVVVRTTLSQSSSAYRSIGDTMGTRLRYDGRNEQLGVDEMVDLTRGGNITSGAVIEWETYDAAGQRLTDNHYYGSGSSSSDVGSVPAEPEDLDWSGWLAQSQVTSYNADGQVTAQASYGRYATDWRHQAYLLNQRNQLPDEMDVTVGATPGATTDGPLTRGSLTSYTAFDAADNVTAYSYSQIAQPISSTTAYGATYSVAYLKKDGYLEKSTTGTATVSGYVPATDNSYYDAFGRRVVVSQTSQAYSGSSQNDTKVFAYDTTGQILQRRSGTAGTTFTATGGYATDHYTYVNGQSLSDMDEAGGIHAADRLTGFSSGDSTQGYVVQSGDTLAGIAQAVYGNGDLGYIVAEANGLSGDGDLVVGQKIELPSITTHSNSATTFKPYDPGQIVGSTTPSLPMAPPVPSQAGCSVVEEIIIVAIVVVASVFTAGLAAEAMAGTLSTAGIGGAMSAGLAATTAGALGTAAVGVGGSMIGAGVVVGGALSTVGIAGMAAGAAAAFVGGALGSAAGQLTGDAMHISHGLSWRQMLAGGLTAAAGSAITGEMGDVHEGLLTSGNWEKAAVSGATTSLAGTAADKVSGVAQHFSWAAVAASAVAAGTTAELAPAHLLGLNAYGMGADFTNHFVEGALDMQAGRKLGLNTPVDYGQIAEDAFGNAIADYADGLDAALPVKAAQQTTSGFLAEDPQQKQDEINAEPQGLFGSQTSSGGQAMGDATPFDTAMGGLAYGDGAGDFLGIGPSDYQGGPVYTLHPLDYTLPAYQSAETFPVADEARAVAVDMMASSASASPEETTFTHIQNQAMDFMVRTGAWGAQQNNLLGDATHVLAGVGYVLAAPIDVQAANAEMAGWKSGVQEAAVQVGAWGDRQGGVLGGVAYYGAGGLSVADEILQPDSVLQAGLIVASPAIGKVVGAGISILNEVPGLGYDIGAAGGQALDAIGGALSRVEFAGSRGGADALGFQSQLGAVGDDLSGFRPGVAINGAEDVDILATDNIPKSISTPYGDALQSSNADALAARSQVDQGATLYRYGTTSKSHAAEGQFWSLEIPTNPGFAERYGIPPANVENANFIETAILRQDAPYITRPAPGVGANPGGGIEVITEPNGVKMIYFRTH
ncbi:MAG: putative Ig domain-containing protein [Rhodanobacter sp.]